MCVCVLALLFSLRIKLCLSIIIPFRFDLQAELARITTNHSNNSELAQTYSLRITTVTVYT